MQYNIDIINQCDYKLGDKAFPILYQPLALYPPKKKNPQQKNESYVTIFYS